VKFYLSSYKIENEPEKLKALVPADKRKIGYIPSALDFSTEPEKLARHLEVALASLANFHFATKTLNIAP